MGKHSDVLIIGGGIIGLASAYYLARAGQSVRLLEQNTIGSLTCIAVNRQRARTVAGRDRAAAIVDAAANGAATR